MTNSITVEEYLKQNKNSTILIDVRDSEELNLGKIENSIHITWSPSCSMSNVHGHDGN